MNNFFRAVSSDRFFVFLAIICAAMVWFWHHFIFPNEDATILFRYAENLVKSGEITYNIGGARTEGATDFLYMVAISGFGLLGIPAFLASLVLNFAALFGIIYLFRIWFNLSNLQLVLLFIAHCLLPGSFAAYVGFSVFVFEFNILLAAYFFVHNRSAPMYATFLSLCLLRPEGVVFGIVACLYTLWKNWSWQEIQRFSLYLILPGIIYFLWRWSYFELFLPLPFYVKAEYESLFTTFSKNVFSIAWVTLVSCTITIVLGGLIGKNAFLKKPEIWVAILSFLIVPFVFYCSMNLIQNVGNRFFNFIPALCFVLLAYQIGNSLWFGRTCLILALVLTYERRFDSWLAFKPSVIAQVGTELDALDVDLKIAASEAGRIAFYSKGNVVDLWGLNTKEFSKRPSNGTILKDQDFDLIVLHTNKTAGCASKIARHKEMRAHGIGPNSIERDWNAFIDTNIAGVDPEKYRLFAQPVHPNFPRRDFYFVRKNGSSAKEVSEILINNGASDCGA